jgi:integrase
MNKDMDLLFPSFKGKYLDLNNFTQRIFTPIIKQLVELGEIENQLPTYHLRHTFITQMIRKGVDIATIANLVGNSPETILSNYLGADKGITLPNLFE